MDEIVGPLANGGECMVRDTERTEITEVLFVISGSSEGRTHQMLTNKRNALIPQTLMFYVGRLKGKPQYLKQTNPSASVRI